MAPVGGTYDQVRQALDDERASRGEFSRHGDSPSWIPQWIQVVIACAAIIVSVMLAYGSLERRIALVEQALYDQRQKLDLIIYNQNGKR